MWQWQRKKMRMKQMNLYVHLVSHREQVQSRGGEKKWGGGLLHNNFGCYVDQKKCNREVCCHLNNWNLWRIKLFLKESAAPVVLLADRASITIGVGKIIKNISKNTFNHRLHLFLWYHCNVLRVGLFDNMTIIKHNILAESLFGLNSAMYPFTDTNSTTRSAWCDIGVSCDIWCVCVCITEAAGYSALYISLLLFICVSEGKYDLSNNVL